MPLEYIVNGRPIEAEELLKTAPKRPVKAKSDAEWHKGFRVVGYKPGEIDQAEVDHLKAKAAWDQADQAALIKEGKRDPGPWNLSRWILNNRPHRISRLFELPSAADQFKTMAEKQGFTHVAVESVEKRQR